MKIKPAEETKTQDLTQDQSRTSELMSLMPSKDEVENMNLKKHSYLQKTGRRNSQMDISDQKSLVDQRNASVRKILALQDATGTFSATKTKGGTQSWLSHYFKTDKVPTRVQQQIQSSAQRRNSQTLTGGARPAKKTPKIIKQRPVVNAINVTVPDYSPRDQDAKLLRSNGLTPFMESSKRPGSFLAQGHELSNDSEYLLAKNIYKQGTNGATRALQTPTLHSPGIGPLTKAEARAVQMSPQRIKLEKYRS